MERQYTQQEIQAFNDAEAELAALGLIVTDKLTTEVIVGWFDQHPEIPATKEAIINFVQQPLLKSKLRWKSQAQMRFEKAAQAMPPQDLDVLEKFLKNNRLWPDDEAAFHNGTLFISVMTGRPYDTSTLASRIPYIMSNLRETLIWRDPSQSSTYRLTGKHSGSDSHFARKDETNQAFSHRVLNHSTGIPTPVASKKMDAFQWDRLANSLVADSGRHSDNAAIQRAVKDTGSGEAGYRAGVAMQKRIRMERERGR